MRLPRKTERDGARQLTDYIVLYLAGKGKLDEASRPHDRFVRPPEMFEFWCSHYNPRMKLAFSTNAFTRHPLPFALRRIAAAGFPAVEILADKPHWYPERFRPSDAATVRRQLDKLGLAVSNVNANCTFGYFKDAPPEAFFEPSLVSPLPRMRRDRIRMIQNTLRFAHAIGAENISITSGKALPTVPPEKGMRLLQENLAPILDLAEKLQVRVGFECEPGLLIEWATELRALIHDVGSKMLGANLDIGHSIVMGENIPKTLKLLKGRIWNCHIEDLNGRKHYHLIPGTGTINWQSLNRSLQAINYDRYLTVELYSFPDKPIHAATRSIRFLRQIFGEQRVKLVRDKKTGLLTIAGGKKASPRHQPTPDQIKDILLAQEVEWFKQASGLYPD